ncbi:MAG: elongation factor G [Planctomycetota bacterium]|jgi:elongation factor G|nr:elongation factor G [Planctomycetota bacterium]
MSDAKVAPLGRIRNIGIIAHIDAGKTTTSERILYYSGKEHRMGEVHDGTAAMDFMQDEQERGITISSACTTFSWLDHQVNLIDTPGHVDFTAEVERSLRVLDGAVCVFCAVAGVEAQSETVWRQADHYHVPRIAFINKMDRAGADFDHVIGEMRQLLGANPLPMQIPVGCEDAFRGVVNLLEREFVAFEGDQGENVVSHPIPADIRDEAELLRQEIIEKAADASEELTEKFLDNGTLSLEETLAGLRALSLSRAIVPVFAGSSLRNKGVQPLLDAVVRYLPSPKDLPPIVGHDPKNPEKLIECRATRKEKLVSLAFKITDDAHGALAFVRVYSGELAEGMRVVVAGGNRKERAARLWRMHANHRERVERAGPGEIVGVSGFKFAATGDTICDESRLVELEPPKFPATVISVAVEPKSNDDRDKLMEVIARLEREDPTFTHRLDRETGQLVLSGMGELHLDVLTTRVSRDYKVGINTGSPRVSYREGVAESAVGSGHFDQFIANKGNYAAVTVRVEPAADRLEPSVALEIDEKSYTPAQLSQIAESVRGGFLSGPLGGYPVIHTRATVTGVRTRESEFTELACTVAAEAALRDAMDKAGAILYEPMMSLEVTVPDEFMGGVIHDLNGRSAEISEIGQRGQSRLIKARVPLAQMFGYATVVRGLSAGRANYSLEPCAYAPAPKNKMKDILGYDV